jgi:hypothetical protein
MHRALLISLALVIWLPTHAGIAGSTSASYETDSYLTAKKKPAPKPKTANKRTNFRSARLNCHPGTMTWADTIRCGYDYPPWALGGIRASRAPAFREPLF